MRLRSLTVLFLAMFGATTLVIGVATYRAAHHAIERLVDRRIDTLGDAVLREARAGDAAAILARIDTLSRQRDSGDVGFELEGASGRRLGGNVTLLRAVPMGYSTLQPGDRIAGLSEGRVQMRDAGGGLRLITVIETEPIDGYDAVRLRNYAFGFGLIALVVIAGTALFGLIVHRRIGEVRATAEAIIDGDMARRVPVAGHGGVFDAQAATFNRMLDRIERLVDNLRNVGSDIAHDMRTPLSRLRGRLERAADAVPDAALDDALVQCDDLLEMFAAILRIAEIEGGDARSGFLPVDLSSIVAEVGETLAETATESGHRLIIVGSSPVTIDGDRQSIAQALFNLVENALRHTPAGSIVTMTSGRGDGWARLVVRDDGPGIAAGNRATALRRFGRVDPSRTSPGHGLGLPLVDAVARLHRGRLSLEDAAPGLVVTFHFPLRDA